MKKKFKFILSISIMLLFAICITGCSCPEVDFEGGAAGDSNYTNLVASGNITAVGNVVAGGSIIGDLLTTGVAQTGATSSVVLTASNSGTTYLLSATGTDITLPALADGLNFKFVVNGAMGVANMIVFSAEGDNINGTLSVNNADVVCAAEDQINFVVDGEVIGDSFEIFSDGSQWILGDSQAQTAAKITCTDPS